MKSSACVCLVEISYSSESYKRVKQVGNDIIMNLNAVLISRWLAKKSMEAKSALFITSQI